MLKLTIPETEVYDSNKNEFIITKEISLRLEHSLVAISEWEAKFKRSFFDKPPSIYDEFLYYVYCMSIDNIELDDLRGINDDVFVKVKEYIEDPRTATIINDRRAQKGKKEIVTSELVYYWMSASQIPFEADKWNINRLFMLLRICSIKNQPPKNNKMSKGSIMRSNSALNAARRAKLHSSG